MIRIVALSDTHRNWDFKAPDGDIFIHAGDIGYFEKPNDPATYDFFLEELDKLPHKHKLIIGGNHDKFLEINEYKFLEKSKDVCTYLKDDFKIINGLCFYGAPWTKYINSRHAFGCPYNRIKEKWDIVQDKTDVLITHQAPYQIFSESLEGREFGCRELQKRVFAIQPILHLFGHIHYGGGNEKQFGNTLFCNVAYDKQYNNKCCVIDLDIETKWLSVING